MSEEKTMDKRRSLEGEDIQRGLESFLDSGFDEEGAEGYSEFDDIDIVGYTESHGYLDGAESVRPKKKSLDVIGGAGEVPIRHKAAPKGPDLISTTRRPERREPVYEYEDEYEEEVRPVRMTRPVQARPAQARQPQQRQQARATSSRPVQTGRPVSSDRRFEEDYEDDYIDKKEIKRRAKQNAKQNAKSAARAAAAEREKERRAKEKKYEEKYEKKYAKKYDKKEKKKKSGFKKILTAIIVIAVILLGLLYLIVGDSYRKMKYERIDSVAHEPVKQDGVYNILLIGNDSRLNGEDGRSDAMILLSVSSKTKTITMTSFLRDMYVEIPGHDSHRLNSAYSWGGPELLMETIEHNFDIHVDRYMLVNFEAFANLVDAVGGVDLELSNDEVKYVNGYLMEYNQLRNMDLTTDWLDQNLSGMIHLNGPQALAYSRNRYIGTDFERTNRQRKVLNEVFKKLPAACLTNYKEVSDGLFPNLTTNLTQNECYMLSLNAWKFVKYERVQQMVPIEGSYGNETVKGMMVLSVDTKANSDFLKQTIYGR